ncbi:hypothetical protein [Dokdonella sp.]|uniref:hypothetical protein n=1 Tax=Dokdonella sp. TaxID=2291710 RepID=UPI0031BC7EF2|nr:hypothetical protein [Dokdonella sp.]
MASGWNVVITGLAGLFLAASVNAQPSSSRGEGPSGIDNTVTIMTIQNQFGGLGPAGSGVVRVDESAFVAGSGLIQFSEVPLGTTNPSYAPGDYGGDASSPNVTFGGYFDGQRIGVGAECPPGAAPTGCVAGNATNPLALDPASPATFTVNDGANPTSPVLSGTPTFNGPIAILFDTDQAGVGLDGGFFDDANSTAITAFARDGSVIGSVTNAGTGIEFLGLVTADGSNRIAGLLFSLVGAESAGFAIDNLRFGTQGQVGPGPGPGPGPAVYVPVPTLDYAGLGALLLLVAGMGAWFAIRR